MKITDKQIEHALISSGGFISHAAKKLNVCHSSISERVTKSPRLQKVRDDTKEQNLDLAETKLLSAVKEGAPWAICFYLKCQGKQRGYVERQEVVGADNKPIKISVKINEDNDDGRI